MAIAVSDELQESVGPDSNRALRAVCVSSAIFLQNIARADMPCNDARRGLLCSMDTNQCHRASRCALQARRLAIQLRKEWSLSIDRTSSPEIPTGNETEMPSGNNTERPPGNDTGMLRKQLKYPGQNDGDIVVTSVLAGYAEKVGCCSVKSFCTRCFF